MADLKLFRNPQRLPRINLVHILEHRFVGIEELLILVGITIYLSEMALRVSPFTTVTNFAATTTGSVTVI